MKYNRAMNRERPSLIDLYQRYKVCLARVTVLTEKGDLANGTSFHVGDGFLVTARHVIEGGELQTITPHQYAGGEITVAGVYLPDDPKVDLAILETNFSLQHYMEKVKIIEGGGEREKFDHIPIGGHLDDWIGDELVLSQVIALGYPRVPLSQESDLVASRGEVNAVIDRYEGKHPHFIISTMGHGGFSGGPVISEYDFLLGIMTGVMARDFEQTGGFPAALTVEPLLTLMWDNKILPGENGRFLRELYGG